MSDRIKKINQLIKQKIADIILRNFSKDALVTVQRADTNKDLKNSKISISVIPVSKSEEVVENLNKQANFIQKELNKIIEIKFTPKIKFEADKGEENADKVEQILRKINLRGWRNW